MDALRKAEEEKKKAEQEAEQETTNAEEPTPAAEEVAASEEQVEIAGDEVVETQEESQEETVADTSEEKPEPPIPDVTLEFEESTQADSEEHTTEESFEQPAEIASEEPQEDSADAATNESISEDIEESVEESPLDSLPDVEVSEAFLKFKEKPAPAPEPKSLSLEPIDNERSGAARQPLDTEVAPDYSAETQLKTLSNPVDADSFAESSLEETAPRSAASHQAPDNSRDSAHQSKHGQDDSAGINIDRSSSASDNESNATQSRKKSAPTPIADLKLTPKRKSLSERSESDRKAAGSVFAAKRKNKRPFRMRRSQRIWLLQIVAGLLVFAGGYYYFFVVNSGGNEFAVPEEFLVNQGTYSEQFNSSIEEVDEFGNEVTNTDIAVPSLEELQPDEVDLAAGIVDPVSNVPVEELIVAPVASQPVVEVADAVDTEVEDSTEQPSSEEVAAVADSLESSTIDSNPIQQSVNLISFTRSAAPPSIDPALQQAYAAFQSEDLGTARELYQQVLQEFPRHRDALLGLASISARNNETAVAMELYSRLLARDPSDTVARAGLLGLRPAGGSEQQERELRRLVEQRPELAPVQYVLGNFYASEGRWNEAQRHYFNALQRAKSDTLQGVPVHPDYAFNLAVSLERLNQNDSALTYYNEAIAFAANVPASFDINIARNRVASLAGVAAE